MGSAFDGKANFCTTDWSVVMQARGSDREPALALLCQRYWGPLYVFIRRQGQNDHAARDTTQAFFAWLLEKDLFRKAAPERGRLRTFLLTSLRNFLSNQDRAAKTLKRGGGWHPLPDDLCTETKSIELMAGNELPPDLAFDRAWVLLLLDRVMEQLQSEMASAGQVDRFNYLKSVLTAADDAPAYEDIAVALGVSNSNVRKMVSRMRRRFRELLLDEIRSTVVDPGDVNDEIRGLFLALKPHQTG